MPTTLSPSDEKTLPSAFYEPIKSIDMLQQVTQPSAIHITEDKGEYRLYIAAPGMRREDFFVCIDKNIITISGGKREETQYYEDRYNEDSEWVQTFVLPENADPLLSCATYINGELEIHIPKGKNTEEKPLLVYVY